MHIKPRPFNQLSKPRPADWGFGVTICITAICEHTEEEAIITACDKMVSMGGYVSGDKTIRKIDPVLYDWTLMFAADDISPITPIVEEIRETSATPATLKGVADLIKRAYRNQRNRQIDDEILQPVGLSMRSFLSDGKSQLSERAYEKIFDRIESYDLGIELLVQGYAQDRDPHVFTVTNPGKCNFYDKVAFWAIGSGQHQAIASLFATGYDKFHPLEVCVAKVLVAKFMAESSVGVGKDTWLLIGRKDVPNKTVFIDPPIQQKIRDGYAALPKIPLNALADVRQAIEEETKRVRAEAKPQLIPQMLKPGP
jgi:20S proteasome alpha/beta subunit